MVNNNSTNNTMAALRSLGIEHHEQPLQGCGPARQMGIEKAKGKYILLGDAHCLDPDSWIEDIIKLLERHDTAVVYGRFSFLSQKDGSLSKAFWKRIVRCGSTFHENFYPLADHDTKQSKNASRTLDGSIHRSRKKLTWCLPLHTEGFN